MSGELSHPAASAREPEPALVQIGDITVSQHWVVTPNGTALLAESQWTVRDMSRTTSVTPTWAVVLAVIGFFVVFLLSLLFLLVKERRVEGYVEVHVRSGNLQHVTQIPRASAAGTEAFGRVHHVQQLAANARRHG